MSSFNFLPTAVVTPLVSSEVKRTKNLLGSGTFVSAAPGSSTDFIHFSLNEQSAVLQYKHCSGSKCDSQSQSFCMVSNPSVEKQKLNVNSENSLQYSSITDCSVKLTNCKKLGSYSKNQKHLKKIQSGVKRSFNTARKVCETDVSNEKPAEKMFNLASRSGKKKIISIRSSKALKQVASSSNTKAKFLKTKTKKKDFSKELLMTTNAKSSKSEKRSTAFKRIRKSVSSKNTSKQLQNYSPKYVDIMRKFPANVAVCSFCHLPAHYLPGLGDLFGPYRLSYNDILERYKSAKQHCSMKQSLIGKTNINSSKQVYVDKMQKTCYITTSGFVDEENDPVDLSLESTSASEKVIDSLTPQLRLFQTLDCILTESGRKPAAKFSRNSKTLRIPGFTGKITTTDNSSSTHCNANKSLLHDMNTIVFIEPTKTFSHHDADASTSENAPNDSTSVDVVHKFNVKAVWVHKACAIWTPGIYCTRNEVVGVANAARAAACNTCNFCHRTGASIPVKYEKNLSYHYACGLAAGMKLDEQTFMAFKA